MRLRSFIPWLVGLSLCIAHGARAQGPTQAPRLHIAWESTSPCPPPADLPADVQQLLGPAGEAPEAWRFVVNVREGTAAGLELTLQVITPHSQRQRALSVASCEQAARTAVVLIAVAIDPTVSAVAPSAVESPPAVVALPTTQDDKEPTPAAPTSEVSPDAPQPLSMRTRDSGWGMGATLGLDIARLARVTPELMLRGVLRAPWLRAELLASWLVPTTLPVPERDDASLDLWAASAAARGCVLAPLWDLRIGPCVMARGGWIHGAASGVENTKPKNTWLCSAGMAGVIEWPLTDTLLLDLVWGGEVSLVRPTFVGRSSTASHTLPLFSTQVGIGFWVLFE